MTNKKEACMMGKRIRAATGIKLPVAMKIGKALVRGNPDKLSTIDCVVRVWETCNCGLNGCGWYKLTIAGPRGEFVIG